MTPNWQKPKCPFTSKCVNKKPHILTEEYYLILKKKRMDYEFTPQPG